MKRDHTVYILGAGFSRSAAVPVMSEFLDRVRRNYEDPDLPGLGADLELHHKRVLDYRHEIARVQDYVRLDLDNIEVLFSLLETDALLGLNPQLPSSMRHVICHTVSVDINNTSIRRVRVTLQEASRPSILDMPMFSGRRVTGISPADGAHLEFNLYTFALAAMLGAFEAAPVARKRTFITLNYDTIVEQAAWELGLGVDYCTSRFSKVGAVQLGGANAVRLLKLHGSSNWAGAKKRGTKALVHASYRDYGTGRVPLIIPPTWRKADMEPTYGEIWKAAGEALSDATTIVVIGYSLPTTDQHVRHLLTTALSRNPGIHELRVIDFDWRESKSVRTQYEELFEPLQRYGRFHYDGQGFENYVRNLRNDRRLASAISSTSL